MITPYQKITHYKPGKKSNPPNGDKSLLRGFKYYVRTFEVGNNKT